MDTSNSDVTNPAAASRRWQTLPRNARRVAGVLVEKAKTTPENYPLTLNSLVNGCNQKSNRFPQMSLEADHVDDALEHLRKLGAVAEIQGDGRVDKYRHLLYDWLGVDKVELAVMGELLLRGAQTLGDLRGRAARMEAIKDIGALRPIVSSLHQKGLLIYLTPPGRGAVVTHNLYEPQELDKIRNEHGGYVDDGQAADFDDESSEYVSPASPQAPSPASVASPSLATGPVRPAAASAPPNAAAPSQQAFDKLTAEVARLAEELGQLRSELHELKSALGAD
ncbi:MAG: DUF480 domain-containing protein [Planctomycetales bacterium]|nr:DUF480 domain-containing protein [Planctomycetales bacterium]